MFIFVHMLDNTSGLSTFDLFYSSTPRLFKPRVCRLCLGFCFLFDSRHSEHQLQRMALQGVQLHRGCQSVKLSYAHIHMLPK